MVNYLILNQLKAGERKPLMMKAIIFNITAIIFKINMEPQTIIRRISECIDDLGLLLDQIYKFPQKQREQYFDRIQNMKNKLVILKSNLRQTNISATEKQYKQIYLATNTLKNDILQQCALLPTAKENRQSNKFREVKENKKNYQEAMKLIIEKDQEITGLKTLLYQKQQLIKINYEELRTVKRQYQILLQGNRLSKYDQTSFSIEFQSTKTALLHAQSAIIEMSMRQQQKDKAFNSAITQLQRLKIELIAANQRIYHFQHFTQTSTKKTRFYEDNAKKLQRQTQDINQNYRIKQHESFRKLKQIGQLEFQLNVKIDFAKQLQQQNRRLRQDLQVMESQTHIVRRQNAELKKSSVQQKERLNFQFVRLRGQIENGIIRQNELKKLLQEADRKYLIVISKINAAQQHKVKQKQAECKNELLLQKIAHLQHCLQQSHGEIDLLSKQRQATLNRIQKESNSIRDREVELFKLKQKVKLRDQEKTKLMYDLQISNNRIRQIERAKIISEMKQKQVENQIFSQKAKLIKYQQKFKTKDKQIQNLKIKLLRAKIETVHQIREVIS